jgi:phosphate transport system protein
MLDKELEDIRNDLLRLSSMVEQAIDRAVRALEERDASLAQQIIDQDMKLNELRRKIEDDCVHVLATQQPMAGDLRMLVAALSVAMNLERMGDHAEGISTALVTDDADAVGELTIDLAQMSRMAREMLSLAMDAHVEANVEKANAAAAMDDDLDTLYKRSFSNLIDRMIEGDLPVSRGTYQLWAAHNLERIGDRVTNICERVVFAATGDSRDMNP